MALKKNLPEFVAEEPFIKEILEAIEPEIDKIKLRLSDILLENCVTTASEEGTGRFEKDYSIKVNANFTLDERKKEIINKMLAKKRLTRVELANFIKRNIDNGQYYISNYAEKYRFQVMLTDEKYVRSLYNALLKARPAHLVFDVVLVAYERRCGTFRCNQKNI